MKKPSRFLRVLGVAGLLVGLLAATMAPAMAQDEGVSQDWLDDLIGVEGAGFLAGNNTIFYPWVANDDDFGLGSADTSISVQNLEDRDTVITIFVGNGAGGFDEVTTAFLAAYAAKTFHASALGIAEGEGAPVMVTSFVEVTGTDDVNGFPLGLPGVPDEAITTAPADAIALVETPIILSNPVADDTDDDENDGGDSTQVDVCVVNYHTAGQPLLGVPHGYVATVDHTFVGADGDVVLLAGEWLPGPFTQQELQDTLNLANEANEGELINPFGGINNDGDCFDVIESDEDGGALFDSVAIGGVAKQAVDGEALPSTSEVDTAVSGYNALNGVEIAYFDEWYLPIVQTNCGPGGCWDSMIRVANLDSLNNAVTVRFFPADDGSGSLQEGFQIQALVNGGDTWHINLGDYVPDEWVGTAHILSDGAVFAMVDRYKVGYNMWITNTGSSADFENLAQVDNAQGRYALFAPHVLLDYFGWNTGINVANLAAADNNISIQYFNLLGNATEVLNQRLAAHGMTYFYDPSIPAQDGGQDVTTDPNAGIVGSAIIWSDFPVAAAVDATKYPETDPNGGADLFQATSYNATANVFPWQAVPLIQKGSAADGMGDTSGINIMNPNSVAVTANVFWVNPSGFQADNFGTSGVTIPGFANGFVYTLWQHNLPNGFLGAAQVVATGPVAAVSANVNYEVDGDGSAIFNAFNPCGLYRAAGPCTFGDVFAPGGQSVTKYFIVDDGDDDDVVDADDVGIPGVNFSIVSTSGAGFQRDAVSGPDGSLIITNVPVGTYELFVNAVPEGFVAPDPLVAQDTFTVNEGEDVVLVNRLAAVTEGFTKTVVAAEFVPADPDDPTTVDEVVLTEEGLAGVDIVVYTQVGTTTEGEPVLGEEVFAGTTGEGGVLTGDLVAGDYVLCIEDADGLATNAAGETVEISFEFDPDADPTTDDTVTIDECEAITITEVDDDTVDNNAFVNGVFVSDVAATTGSIDVTTTTTDVEGVVSPAPSIPVDIYLLAEGGDCGDITPGVTTPTDSGVTSLSGELTFADLEPGTYCVVADFDGTDVFGEVTVVAGAVVSITLDESGEVIVADEGLTVTTTTDGVETGDVAVGAFLLAEGETCADADLTVAADATGTTDTTTGVVTLTGLADGTYCVVADFDGDGFDDIEDISGEADVVDGFGAITLDLVTGGAPTTGDLSITTTVDDVLEGGVDVGVFDGTCAAAGTTLLDSGTTDLVTAEVTLTGFAAGDVCVVGDFNDDGLDAGDVLVDATVVAGVTTDVTVNEVTPP